MSGDVTSVLQGLIPEAIPSQRYHMNMGPIFNSYRDMSIWNVVWLENYFYSFIYWKSCKFQFNKCSKWSPSAWMHTLTRSTTESVTFWRTASCSENLLKQFISCVHLSFIHRVTHLTTHMKILRTVQQWMTLGNSQFLAAVGEHYWTHLDLGFLVVEIVANIPERQQSCCHYKTRR
jgi:hypothetical protein